MIIFNKATSVMQWKKTIVSLISVGKNGYSYAKLGLSY
jgi:hypothetical protein